MFSKAKRERRLILAEREEEARLIRLATAWDTWREKLQALRLMPLVLPFVGFLRRNVNLLAFLTGKIVLRPTRQEYPLSCIYDLEPEDDGACA